MKLDIRGYWKESSYNKLDEKPIEITAKEVKYRDGYSELRMQNQDSLAELLLYDDIEEDLIIMFYTGFDDSKGVKIYDGDIIGDWVETDEGRKQTQRQVFWHEEYGCWRVDYSFDQDRSSSEDLWLELRDFDFEILGNIYENPELIKK